MQRSRYVMPKRRCEMCKILPRSWHEQAGSDVNLARFAWAHLAEPQDPKAQKLIAEDGHAQAFSRVLREPSKYEAFASRLGELDLVEQSRRLERLRIRVVNPDDEEWPAGLDDLAAPPHCVFVKGEGHLARLAGTSVALVGARAATHYGQRIAAELALGVGRNGMSVVSGGAFGIDAAAHRGALHGEASTVCVLAGGVDRTYPSAHEALFDAISTDGVLVSELPLGFAPMRHRFLHRNRLIAAMSPGTVVVEAGLRSGSLSTARRAEELSRLVGAVPGPVTSAASAGCHELIRDGAAMLVTSAADVRELVGRMDAASGQIGGSGTQFDRPEDVLSPTARLVWDALPVSSPASVDEVARLAGRATKEVLAALGELNSCGMATRSAGLWRKGKAR